MGPRRRPVAVLLALLALAASVAATGCGKSEEEKLSEPKREGLSFKLDELDYNVFITRQLNIRNAEDHDYYRGPDAPPGSALYGVFLQVCNDAASPRTSASDFKIVDTQNEEFRPKKLPKTNFFAYQPTKLHPEGCLPIPGSAAASGPTGGSLLLFQLPISATENRPLELEVRGPFNPKTGKYDKAKVELDI